MRNDIQLFINDREVEFSSDPQILLNFTETELRNPTIIKNSFSKEITLEGTNQNNSIFEDIWRLDRYQIDEHFNPIRKAGFKLFINGELFQRGYCKLNNINRQNNQIKYSITLYGGLGSFFWSLGNIETDTGVVKKSLKDLNYSYDDIQAPDLDFVINKDTVYNAWSMLTGEGGDGISRDKFRVINFIPCYNGKPSDFDANKVLINNNGINHNIFQNTYYDGGYYQPVLNGGYNLSGYSLGEMEDELTEWETFDLRSYLQRPCLSMKRLIQACCQPENNGGYEVKLDSHFFNSDNPYYEDAWVTLGMLKEMVEDSNQTEEISAATLTKSSWNTYDVDFTATSLGSLNNARLKFAVEFSPSTYTAANDLYSYREYQSKTDFTLQGSRFVKTYKYSGGVIVQLQALNGGEVVAQSKAYLLASDKNWANKDIPLWSHFYREGPDTIKPTFEYVGGYWQKNGANYQFVDYNGNPTVLDFSLLADSDFTSLRFKIETPRNKYFKFAFNGWRGEESDAENTISLYTQKYYNTTGNRTKEVVEAIDEVVGQMQFRITEMSLISTDYENLFSETLITKDKLLGGDKTPADYLISYCKLFGLYFYMDSTEISSDPDLYPSGVIHIMDRDTFYTDEVIDLSDKIDYSKPMSITPATAEAKWYRFDTEQVESQVGTEYKDKYLQNYGSQMINTNYNFDTNTIDLYDGNIFKSAIMVREKDKYFKQPVESIPPYVFNGLTYHLFNRSSDDEDYGTCDIKQEISTTSYWHNINDLGLDYYDFMPKVQFHSKDNEGTDGRDVLVFFKGGKPTVGGWGMFQYYLTDDVFDMVTLNDATPCWLLTNSEFDANGKRIAYKLTSIPNFTRDIIIGEEGNIVHSWNFGHPQITFVPNTFTKQGDSIYDKCWRNYIGDLYDVNTRKLECYANINTDGKPWAYWLRRFYWFENSLWRLNKITDLNMSSFNTTKMEFIKVQDMTNYELSAITYFGSFEIIFDQAQVNCSAQTVTGKVINQSGSLWEFDDVFGYYDGDEHWKGFDTVDYVTPTTGIGEVTNFSIQIPANSGDTKLNWQICLEDSRDNHICGYFEQLPEKKIPYLSATPTTVYLDYMQDSTNTFNISSNIGWGIDNSMDDYEHFDFLPYAATGNSMVTVTAITPNLTTANIETLFVVEDDNAELEPVYVRIIQRYSPEINPTQGFTFPASGGTLGFKVSSSYDFVFRSLPDWIVSITDKNGNSYYEGQKIPASMSINNTFYFTAEANTTGQYRYTTVCNMGYYLADGTLSRSTRSISINQLAG